MQNAEEWVPTKFLFDGATWRSSLDPREVHVSSRLISELMIERYAAAISRHAAGRLADIGCGKVPLYGIYRSRVDEVICIDWPHTAHGTSFIDAFCDLNEGIALPTGHVDTIVCTDVLEHLHQPEHFYGELARICRPGGHLVLGVPYLYPIHEAPHDYCRHTEFSLRRLSDRAGFDILELEAYGGGIQAVAVLYLKTIVGRARLLKLVEPAIRHVGTHPWVRRLAQRRTFEMPLGYCLVGRRRG